MSLQKNFEDFDDGVEFYLLESERTQLTDSSIKKVLHYLHKSNHLQILYSYGIDVVSDLVSYFLSIENYEQCALFKEMLRLHNKSTGENLVLIL